MNFDFYKSLIRPILFEFGPETSHHIALEGLNLLSKLGVQNKFCYENRFEKELSGIKFPNQIGLAAGFDKNGLYVDSLDLLGFGFIEIGTITLKPQLGSPKPRVFRFQNSKSILNFMGFNNDGVEVINKRLEKRKKTNIIVGANISKNKYTENDEAHKEYISCMEYLHDNVDYFTLNVSSPNTPKLRDLLDYIPLKKLLESIQNENQKHSSPKPIFLKISPDLDRDKLNNIIDLCLDTNISGIVATNTSIQHEFYRGGISGNPLIDKSKQFIFDIKSQTDKLVIVSSGGIMSDKIAKDRLESGADLVQLYTGLIYEGPLLPRNILKSL
jgi:dihydroorotate dehydrogenase